MKQYNILYGSESLYYISEGTPQSRSIFDGSKRTSFNSEQGLLDYIRIDTNTKRAMQFNIDQKAEDGLEGKIGKINRKATFKRMDLRSPPKEKPI